MSKAAVIGGGVIGGGWAARFLLNGWDVVIYDPDPEAERKIGEVLVNARWALPMLYDRALPPEGRLTWAKTIAEAVEGADYIQESVPERLDLKHRVYAEIEAANPDAPLGSSTSGFKPSELREGMATGARVFVAHPFNPVYLLPLIEVVPGEGAVPAIIERAKGFLKGWGLYPLEVRKEIDAHIADRFLEAVWREALWLVRDGIATTEEIDNAIRYGFGLRWAQMGLFETYRIAGGEGGMAHFIAQFGPCLSWPWTKLMDVPELTDELIRAIGDQSDAQSGHMTIRELERKRDTNLISMMRALRARGNAAGALIAEHEASIPAAGRAADLAAVPAITARRVIPVDWTDYNGHMNESRYGQIWSDGTDELLREFGAGPEMIDSGSSFFTVQSNTAYRAEAMAGDRVRCETRIEEVKGKKLRVTHRMIREGDEELLAEGDQILLHVDMATRRSAPPPPDMAAKMEAMARAHAEGRD
ncbi:carnitine 3-dehydrogenase [Silicimonas sp. MF1-12-2]|uniref:carnitine 3-dehydrogenase n=1 Tax=Silicimonas sp. MF1-12-2 TaxID=3384793 RepID=UPI0039B38E2F